MITKVTIKNFKLFEKQEFELEDVILLAGPNNSGKTTLLQAIATWYFGLQRWMEERSRKPRAKKRTGIPMTRKEFTIFPLREMNLLWSGRQTGAKGEGIKPGTPNLIEIGINGKIRDKEWEWSMEFQYANPEMVYARPSKEKTYDIQDEIKSLRIVHIPPFSGITAEEPKHDIGYQDLLIGQGRPGEIIRNLLWEVSQDKDNWDKLKEGINEIFKIELQMPQYSIGQPFIVCEYREEDKRRPLDISNIGSGTLQVLMLFAFFYARPSTILLFDEPDAHLHIILQREVYDFLKKVSQERGCQLLIATHSEVFLDATDPTRIISMVGRKVKRLVKKVERDQVREALKRLRTIDLTRGNETGGVLYLEGESDERILREWAKILQHPVKKFLEGVFVHHLGGRSLKEAKTHFFALRAVFPEVKGMCILDGDSRDEPDEEMIREGLKVVRWRRYEIENYLLIPDAIKRYVNSPLIDSKIEEAFWKQVPKNTDLFSDHVSLTRIKASDEFLGPLLNNIDFPTPHRDFYLIAAKMKQDEIHPEIQEKLDALKELVSVE
ncbi:MAG: AAA family ATPase [bacterium]